MSNCPFCNPKPVDIVIENNYGYARYDIYPVSPGHLLIIPFQHIADYFDISESQRNGLFNLIEECKSIIDHKHSPDGYNIGINIGAPAGQTIFHLHIHLIPRYFGDMEEPRGGVRGVIPEKQQY